MNTEESMDDVRCEILQQLQSLQGAPSVQFQEVPPPFMTAKQGGENDGGDEDDRRPKNTIGGEIGSVRKDHDAELAA